MSFQDELEKIQKVLAVSMYLNGRNDVTYQVTSGKLPTHAEPVMDNKIAEAITSIINLVDKEVIGEDEPNETDKWTPEMDSYIRQARQVIYGRNALRAKQRAIIRSSK